MKDIGKTIRVLRELAGIRQGELAKRINVSANYISLIENQKREPSLKILEKISSELKIPVSVFFWDDVDPESIKSKKYKDIATKINSLHWDLVRTIMNKGLKE